MRVANQQLRALDRSLARDVARDFGLRRAAWIFVSSAPIELRGTIGRGRQTSRSDARASASCERRGAAARPNLAHDRQVSTRKAVPARRPRRETSGWGSEQPAAKLLGRTIEAVVGVTSRPAVRGRGPSVA